RVDLVPVLGPEIDAFGQVGPELLELLQAFRPCDDDRHLALQPETCRLAQRRARLRPEIEDEENVRPRRDGVGDVAAELLFVEGVVAVADVLYAFLLEDRLGLAQKAFTKYILRRDRVPALGVRHLLDQGKKRLID